MFNKYLRWIFIYFILSFISACNDVDQKSDEELSESQAKIKKLQTDSVIGYWDSELSDYSFEFIASTSGGALRLINESIKTGKIYKNKKLIGRFYWEISFDGTISINTVENSCFTVPANLCVVASKVTIIANGDSVENASWNIFYDNNNNGDTDLEENVVFTKKAISLANFGVGEHYLQTADNDAFDIPLLINVSNDKIDLQLDIFDKLVTLSTNLELDENGQIYFGDFKSLSVNRSVEVFIDEQGYQDLVLNEWYSDVILYKSINNSYILTFKAHSELEIPDNIDISSVQRDELEKTQQYSLSGNLVSEFIEGFRLEPYDTYNTMITVDGYMLNSISITSASRGKASHLSMTNFGNEREFAFSWTQNSEGLIVLDFDAFDEVSMQAIKAVNGGYQVLYINKEEGIKQPYSIHDFIMETEAISLSSVIPGRFMAGSNDGFSQVSANFFDDNTVELEGTFSPQFFLEEWIVDDQGDIVSFECRDYLGIKINSYEECLSSFDDVGNDSLNPISYGVIRRFHFMHQDGNNFQVRYNSIIWLGVGEGPEDILTFNWTYRLVRVGDGFKTN